MSDNRPVGFFDSGIGGTCILKAFQALCPNERTIYLADTEHCPYGNRPADEIVRLSEANVTRRRPRQSTICARATLGSRSSDSNPP